MALAGDVCSGGGFAQGGGVVSQHALRQTSPCGQTDRCKNITFATLLRTETNISVLVIKMKLLNNHEFEERDDALQFGLASVADQVGDIWVF